MAVSLMRVVMKTGDLCHNNMLTNNFILSIYQFVFINLWKRKLAWFSQAEERGA